VERGNLVISAGGGGIPVVRDDGLRGVEAVVDKDKTSQLLASELGADTLVVLTDVEFAYVSYETPDQRPLCQPSPEEVRAHLDAGEFGEGSMRPKMEACLRFLKQGGERAVVTSPDHLMDALAGETGTRVRA
jgi:carbamate kinase